MDPEEHVDNAYTLWSLDAIHWLECLRDATVDLIVTDPPYESLEKHRKRGTTTRLKKSASSSNEWFKTIPNSVFPKLLAEMYRVLKPDSHCYIMCDQETGFLLHNIVVAAGQFTFKKAIIWDKLTLGMGYSYRARHEWVVFLSKGKRPLNDMSTPDVLRVKRVYRGHPGEKPVDLSRILIRQSTRPHEVVCDPFCGSGSTGEAALLENRRFIGNDISASSIRMTSERLHQTQCRLAAAKSA